MDVTSPATRRARLSFQKMSIVYDIPRPVTVDDFIDAGLIDGHKVLELLESLKSFDVITLGVTCMPRNKVGRFGWNAIIKRTSDDATIVTYGTDETLEKALTAAQQFAREAGFIE